MLFTIHTASKSNSNPLQICGWVGGQSKASEEISQLNREIKLTKSFPSNFSGKWSDAFSIIKSINVIAICFFNAIKRQFIWHHQSIGTIRERNECYVYYCFIFFNNINFLCDCPGSFYIFWGWGLSDCPRDFLIGAFLFESFGLIS